MKKARESATGRIGLKFFIRVIRVIRGWFGEGVS
jgi:hypothetical protein